MVTDLCEFLSLIARLCHLAEACVMIRKINDLPGGISIQGGNEAVETKT
jgi:hypothetical protein